MKILHAMLFAAAISLGGCSTQEIADTVSSITGAQPSAPEANTVAAAANLFVSADTAADAFIKTPAATPAVKAQIAQASKTVRGYLDSALTAEKQGDSAAVAVALKGFNQAFPDFFGILQQNGVNP